MSENVEPKDREKFEPGFGPGGVPFFLLLGYIAYLCFFTWYALEFQLPDYMKKGPFTPPAESASTVK